MKFDDIKNLVDELLSDMPKANKNKTSFNRKIDTEFMKGVIDISLNEGGEIPKEDFSEAPVVKDYKYWILKLDRYYKNPAMRVPELNTATLKFYAKLADTLEARLNQEGTTVARLVSKIRREGGNYDIYYTLYRIAETYVINFYNPLSTKSADRSFNILQANTDESVRKLIEATAEVLLDDLKPATPAIIEHFSLTPNNKVSLWWDPSGELREKYQFSKSEELAIDQISKRANILWKNDPARELLLDLYLATLRDVFDKEDLETHKLVKIISPYNFSKMALDNILLISESNLRDKLAFYTSINTDKANEMLADIEDGRLLAFVNDFQKQKLENSYNNELDEIYRAYFRDNPAKTKDIVNYLKTLKIDDMIDTLMFKSDQANFMDVVGRLAKDPDPTIAHIGLYFIYGIGANTRTHDKLLFKLILEENYNEYLSLISERDLDAGLLAELRQLKNPKPKKIKVDTKKIAISRDELTQTVDMIAEFIDEEDEADPHVVAEEEQAEIINEPSNPYEPILTAILAKGYMATTDLEPLALKEGLSLNSFIGEINDSLFDYVGDQTLILEGERLVIDEFYVDMIKEYLDGN